MVRRRLSDWHAVAFLLVPLVLQLPRQASAVPFNYMAYCHDLDAGRNSLFVYTVRQFQERMASTYNLHLRRNLEPPHGVNRLVRMFYRLRGLRDSSADIEDLVGEVEAVFLERLERLESHCKRQIHG